MNAEVQVLLDRANARRLSLLGLVEVIPADYWLRRETPEDWTARQHLAHVSTADELLRGTLEDRLDAGYEERRARLLAERESLSIDETIARMRHERTLLTAFLERMDHWVLDRSVALPDVVDGWGRQVQWPLRALLGAWSEHDTGHEAAIRRAVTTPPEASALSVAARRRRS